MNSFRKLTEVAVISSAVTLVAVYIFVGTGGKLPGLNHGNQNSTNGSNVNSSAKKDSVIMPSSKVKVLRLGLDQAQEQTTSPAPQAALAPNQGPSQTIMLGPKSAPVFGPTVVDRVSPAITASPPPSAEDPKRTTIFHGSKSAILPPVPSSGAAQQVPLGSQGYQPASSSTPNVPAAQPYRSAPTNPFPQGSYYSGNRQPQPLPTQQQAVPQYKVQK